MKSSNTKKVPIMFTFLFQSDRSVQGGFRYIHERTNPVECSIKETDDGKMLLRVTKVIADNEAAIAREQCELETDLSKYGGVFVSKKYHLVVKGDKLERKRISFIAKLLTWMTPPGDARNYVLRKIPLYSIIFILFLVLLLSVVREM
ncbi:hypothetical protein ACFQMB_04210 [Pseudobowmanella zhangzhouensis]